MPEPRDTVHPAPRMFEEQGMTEQEVVTFVFGLLIGGGTTWFFAWLYYRKSSQDMSRMDSRWEKKFDNLSNAVKAIIKEDLLDSLHVQELNKLLHKKTIDPDDTSGLPFKACPQCGATTLKYSEQHDNKHDDLYQFVECETCGWSEYTT